MEGENLRPCAGKKKRKSETGEYVEKQRKGKNGGR